MQHEPLRLNWRQYLNPLRLLTLRQVVTWLELNERGVFASLQWFFRFIEKRDPTLRALKRRRLAAIDNLTWDIKIRQDVLEEAAGDDGEEIETPQLKLAKEQHDRLHEAYQGINNLKEAIRFLALAEFRGFAHLEKHRTPDGDVIHLEPVPQWNWSRKVNTKEWLYNRDALDGNVGLEIDPAEFIIRSVEDPIDETCAVLFMRKNLGVKDWDGFLETYGLPPLFVTLPQNATTTDQSSYQEMCEKIISDGRGTLPAGSDIKSVDVANRGKNPFSEHIDYQDMQIVLSGTGGKLTMLNDPTGIGQGASEVHRDTFRALASAEGREISEVLQVQFDAEVLSREFPGQEHLVYFELSPTDVADPDEVVRHAAQLKQAGWKLDKNQLEEKTGYKVEIQEPVAPAPQPGGNGFGGNPFMGQRRNGNGVVANKSGGDKDVILALARAQSMELRGVRERLERIVRIRDVAERDKKLRALQAELPRLLRSMNADPATEKVLRDAMASAFFQGLTEVQNA